MQKRGKRKKRRKEFSGIWKKKASRGHINVKLEHSKKSNAIIGPNPYTHQ